MGFVVAWSAKDAHVSEQLVAEPFVGQVVDIKRMRRRTCFALVASKPEHLLGQNMVSESLPVLALQVSVVILHA